MSAIDFVKECGIDVARRTLGNAVGFGCSGIDLFGGKYIFRTDDLKQIVDAFELVDRFGGYDSVLDMVNNPTYFGDSNFEIEIKLNEAINLVEQCQ